MAAEINSLISIILFIATIVGTFVTVKITGKNNAKHIDQLGNDMANGFKDINNKLESKFSLMENKIEQLKESQHLSEIKNLEEKNKIYLLISEIKKGNHD